MIELKKAREIAEDWISAWNERDLEKILCHYTDELEFVSPLVVSRLGREDGTIRTKRGLRDYFSQGIGPGSELHFELIDVFAGVSSITLYYSNHRNQLVAETMFLNDEGMVIRVFVHHRSG